MPLFSQKYKVTAYSPVHIGSTKKWFKNLHFEQSEDKTDIYNLCDIPFDENELNIEETENFITNYSKQNPIPYLTYPNKIFAHDISQFSKTAWGTPYIPGNSINGFYHTAELTKQPARLKLLNKSKNPDYSGLSEIKNFKIFIGDIEFPMNSIEISNIKILNLTSDSSYGWKKYWPKPTTIQNPLTATSQYLETLKTGESSLTAIKFKTNAKVDLDNDQLIGHIETTANKLSYNIAENELKFFDNCKMDQGYNFYWSLKEKIQRISNGFYVCVGWGIGWNALVGSLHNENNVQHIMRNNNLGKFSRPCPDCKSNLKIDKFKKNKLFCLKCKKSFDMTSVVTQIFPVFPKTRKFVFDRQIPLAPLGWLKFERSDSFEKVRNEETHDIEIKLEKKKSKIIKDQFFSPEEYPAKKSETKHFKKKIKIANRGNFPTKFNIFFNKIAELEFIITINGTTIDDSIDTTRFIHDDKIDELRFTLSIETKGIELLIRTGAVNNDQKNFIINRIWEIFDSCKDKEEEE